MTDLVIDELGHKKRGRWSQRSPVTHAIIGVITRDHAPEQPFFSTPGNSVYILERSFDFMATLDGTLLYKQMMPGLVK